MPAISMKGQKMPASPIRKLVPYAEAAKRAGVEVIHLNIGQPDIKTPAVAIEAVKNLDLEVIAYSHSAGNESYRRKLATYYASVGIEVNYQEIMVTTGGSEALLFAMLSCLNDGDEVIIPEPFYANYNGFSNTANVVVKPITSTIETGFALPAIEAFEEQITEKTKAIMICNPSNPTGYLYSREELEVLRTIALKYDLYIFADEVYREFAYDGVAHTSILQLEGMDQHAVLVDSISKRFSACGARIGALVTKNKEVMATALKFAQARLSPPSLGQIVGEAALDAPQQYITDVIDEYIERRNVLVAGLNDIEGVFCPTPKGAFYVTARLPIDDSEKFCRWMLEDFSHKGKTVMMAPATGFYATKGLGKQEVRMAYVLNTQLLKEAIECLSVALPVYQEKKMLVTKM